MVKIYKSYKIEKLDKPVIFNEYKYQVTSPNGEHYCYCSSVAVAQALVDQYLNSKKFLVVP